MSVGAPAAYDEPTTIRGVAILRALQSRAGAKRRPEELLLDMRLVSDRELACRLAELSGRPVVGLRDVTLDPHLFLYIPVSVALAERLCPLELDGDVLRVASAFIDPDLDHVTSRFPNLQLELVLAPREEILEAIRPVAAGT